MNYLDLIIVVAAVAYGISGFRNGAVVGVCSMIGFFGGAAVGAQLAEPISSHLASGRGQVTVAIVCVLLLAMVGQFVGVILAGRVRRHLVPRGAKWVDAGVGGVIGVFSVLLVAWMVAVPLASSPYPALASAAGHSKIVRGVDDVMPSGVRSLYSSLRGYLDRSGFPPVFGDLPLSPDVSVPAPSDTLSPELATVAAAARRSIVKIYGEAPSCSRGIEGSGFVYAAHRVVTNAHVVAGTRQVQLDVSGRRLDAKVIVYDPGRDVAVLSVPGLDAPALPIAASPASHGDDALVLGYPQDGPYTVRNARIGSRSTISGTDIYGHGHIEREIYALRAVVRTGNSGGPLLGTDGRVLGLVFATALDSSDVGYALTADEILPDLATGKTAAVAVSTGRCTP